MAEERRTLAGLILVMILGAVLRLWGLQFGLPHPFARPDEEVVVDLALGVLNHPNPRFFDWGTLFTYVTAAVYAAVFAIERVTGGPVTDAAVARTAFEPLLILIPRALSAAAGVATIAVLFAAARELVSSRAALLAALFLAVAFLHVRDSHFGVADVPMTFLIVCAFWVSVRCVTRGVTLARAALGGLLCGLAVSTKYNAATILVPAVVAIVATTLGSAPRTPGLSVRAIVVLGLCAAVGFVAGTPYAILDHQTFLVALGNIRRHMDSGHILMTRGWEYHAKFTLRYGVGVPLLVAAMLGPCTLLARRRWTVAALVLSFPVSYYLIVGSGKSVFVRYMVPMVPFLSLAAAVFVDWLSEYLERTIRVARLGDMSAALLAAGIAIPTVVPSIMFDRLMALPDTRATAAERLASEFPEGASMYQNGYTYAHLQLKPRERYAQLTFNDLTNGFERDGTPSAPPDVIVLVESPLETYTAVPPAVVALVDTDYTMVMTAVGITKAKAPGALYDQDDAFFAPFSGIGQARRPGPNVAVFRRRVAK